MEKHIYTLEASPDGENWKLYGRFMEGEPSRFGVPFDANVAVREAESFVQHWKKLHDGYDRDVMSEMERKKHVRIIIDIA